MCLLLYGAAVKPCIHHSEESSIMSMWMVWWIVMLPVELNGAPVPSSLNAGASCVHHANCAWGLSGLWWVEKIVNFFSFLNCPSFATKQYISCSFADWLLGIIALIKVRFENALCTIIISLTFFFCLFVLVIQPSTELYRCRVDPCSEEVVLDSSPLREHLKGDTKFFTCLVFGITYSL